MANGPDRVAIVSHGYTKYVVELHELEAFLKMPARRVDREWTHGQSTPYYYVAADDDATEVDVSVVNRDSIKANKEEAVQVVVDRVAAKNAKNAPTSSTIVIEEKDDDAPAAPGVLTTTMDVVHEHQHEP